MGADIKILRNRIKSVNSTLHLTKAMELVASSKIRKANDFMQKSRDYEKSIDTVISSLLSSPECKKSPFMRLGGDRTRLIVIAGDRGLAGGYNANVFRLADTFTDAEIIPIGYRACDRFGKERVSSEHFSTDYAYTLAKKLCIDFAENKFDRLVIVCTKYVSAIIQETNAKEIFPLKAQTAKTVGTIFEPDEITVFSSAITEYCAGVIISSVCESFACENAARRMAMDNAQKNANRMLDDLQPKYNRARQGAITQEITEIVAGDNA